METVGMVPRLDISNMLNCHICGWLGDKSEAVVEGVFYLTIYRCPTCGQELRKVGGKVY